MAVQSDAITSRILQDAHAKGDEIKNSYALKAQAILLDAQNYSKAKQKECKNAAKVKQKELQDKYSTLAKIEGNKIVLQAKQKVLESVKTKALDFLCAQNTKDTLKFVENLIEKNAEKEDVVLFNLKGVKAEDIKKFKCVKTLELQVQSDDSIDYGVVLSGKNCDKNLLFKTLIDNAFAESESEICFMLFN